MIAVARHIGFGWVAERSNATVLKTVEGATLPGVRIPPHPPGKQKKSTIWWIFYFKLLAALVANKVLIATGRTKGRKYKLNPNL